MSDKLFTEHRSDEVAKATQSHPPLNTIDLEEHMTILEIFPRSAVAIRNSTSS
jgi:hypothetical protein